MVVSLGVSLTDTEDCFDSFDFSTPVDVQEKMGSCFFSVQSTYAQEYVTKKEAQKMLQDQKNKSSVRFINTLNDVLRWLYIILWPLLFIAGLAVDNTLVYWELFHFDAVLVGIWDMIKNMANFSLFFIALFFILKGMWQNKISDIQKTVKKLLIAWILIQASWFLMGAIIDISTIAVYWVWGLPGRWTEWMKENTTVMDRPILQSNISILRKREKNEKLWTYIYHTYWKKTLAECIVKDYHDGLYIIGMRKFAPNGEPKIGVFEKNICVYNQRAYRFTEFGTGILSQIQQDPTKKPQKYSLENEKDYDNAIEAIRWDDELMKKLITQGQYIVPLLVATGRTSSCGDAHCGMIAIDDDFYKKEEYWYTLRTVLDSTKWHIWPFITLYYSLLWYTDIGAKDELNWWEQIRVFWLFLMKAVFAVLLIIPLLAMVVVLILRVWVLWLAIAFLPFLVIKWIFFASKQGESGNFIDKHFEWWNLIKIIFAPVIMVFAVSISLIFMHAIDMDTIDSINREDTLKESFHLSTEKEGVGKKGTQEECPGGYIEVLGLISICDKWWNLWSVGNTFLDMIEKLFGLAIMWFLLFAAIKTNSIWNAIWKTIQNTAQKWMWTVPIVPVAGGVWLNTLNKEILSGNAVNRVIAERDRQDSEKLKQLMPSMFGHDAGHTFEGVKDTARSQIITKYNSWADINEIYHQHSADFKRANIFTADQAKKEIETYLKSITMVDKDAIHKAILEGVVAGNTYQQIFQDTKNNKAMVESWYSLDTGEKAIQDAEEKWFGNAWVTKGNITTLLSNIEQEIEKLDEKIKKVKGDPEKKEELEKLEKKKKEYTLKQDYLEIVKAK